jgi:hypothetical protein
MSRTTVEQLVDMLDLAFEPPANAGPTDGWHSLIGNLKSIRAEDWEFVPKRGKRTIAAIVIHCGFAFRVYADYGFGPGRLPIGEAVYRGTLVARDVDAWLREGHRILRDAIAATTDDQLAAVGRTHWGEEKPRIWFARTIIEHTLYHAGEINHIRALSQENDKW